MTPDEYQEQCNRCVTIQCNGITLRCDSCPVPNGLLLPDWDKIEQMEQIR